MYAMLSCIIKHRLEGIKVQLFSPSHLHPPPLCIALPMYTFPHLSPKDNSSLVTLIILFLRDRNLYLLEMNISINWK